MSYQKLLLETLKYLLAKKLQIQKTLQTVFPFTFNAIKWSKYKYFYQNQYIFKKITDKNIENDIIAWSLRLDPQALMSN